MNSMQPDHLLHKQIIYFPNSNTAIAVTTPLATPAPAILHSLGMQSPSALLIVIGGADKLDHSFAAPLQLLARSIAHVAAEAHTIIIDGGTQVGIMAIIGQSVADQGRQSPLLGVSPADLVTYPGAPSNNFQTKRTPLDPNHSHFVLVHGSSWGSETSTLFALADALSTDQRGQHIHVVTILINGGQIARSEAWHSVQRRWPIIVIAGSDRTADDIAHLWQEKNQPHRISPSNLDPEYLEIVAKGDIHLFPLTDEPQQFATLLQRLLHPNA